MFSGAMGGWHSAVKHIPGWDVEVALDLDPDAVASYAMNHLGTVVNEPARVDHGVQEGLLIVCKAIQNLEWLHVLNYRRTDVATVSSPCQSWSTLGTQERLQLAKLWLRL